MPIFLVKEPARVDGNLFLILALIAPALSYLEHGIGRSFR
jgi:hypothetical protein